MQVLQDNFFYHLSSRFGGDGGSTLKAQRQLLAEEQKLCKVRARRFSLETNRRRKALEERQKQWDAQEQQLRDNILQQRRLQVQDATERFQRAHLPLSQRRKQFSHRRNVPNIEDALRRIQDTMSSYTLQSCLISSKSKIYRTCTTSPKPSAVSKSSNQALSAVEACTKRFQEQSTTYFGNSQETEKIQAKQQGHTSQESHLSDACTFESLSSKDSLDNEDPNSRITKSSFSSFLLNSAKPHPVLGKHNYLYPTSDLRISAMMLFGDNLLHSTKLHELKQKKDSEGPNNNIYVSKSSREFSSDKKPKSVTRPSLHNCNLLTFCEMISADPQHFDANSPQIDPDDNIITNRITPTNLALESLCLKKEPLLDLRQQRVHDDRQLRHLSATERKKDILFGSTPESNIFLNGNTIFHISQEGAVQQMGKENHYVSSNKEPSASKNNLNKVSSTEAKIGKPVNTALLQHARLSNIQSDTLKCLHHPEEEVQKGPASVRFLKGILKKQSKYISDDSTTCVCDSGHLIFAKQLALEIRDSVELARAKSNDEEGNKTVKKKLRWLDEVHMAKEDKEQNLMKLLKGKSSFLSPRLLPFINLEDHQLSVTAVSGASKPGPIKTPASSTGYHLTKRAWADVGVQVNLLQEQADKIKVPQSSTRTPKVARREHSARVRVGPVSSRTRKGSVTQLQSPTKVNQIAKTKGKLMIPCPPPRMEEKVAHVTKTLYGTEHASVICKQPIGVDQVQHKNNSEDFSSSCTHHGIRTDNTAVMHTPLPPSLEGNVKCTPSSRHRRSRRRATVSSEKGLCLDRTPTDEEISQLWHGVRSALATKEAKTMLSRRALESGRIVKSCVKQSRHPPASGNTRLAQLFKPTKQTAESERMLSSIYDGGFPREGLQSAADLHMSQVHAEGPLEERDVVAAMETAQTQRSGTVQQCNQQQGLTTICLKEQKVLLSLNRLNHQLHCVQEHVGGNTGTLGLVVLDAPSTKEAKVSTHHKHRASSTRHRAGYRKKIGL